MNELDEYLPTELQEAIKPKALIYHYQSVFQKMGNVAKAMDKNFLTKFERRVESDYIGKEPKLKAIFKKITAVEKAYTKAVEDLKNEVG